MISLPASMLAVDMFNLEKAWNICPTCTPIYTKIFSYSQKQEYPKPGKNTSRAQCVLNILIGIQSLGNHCQQEQMSGSVLRRYNKHGSFQHLPDTSAICYSKISVWNKIQASLNAETWAGSAGKWNSWWAKRGVITQLCCGKHPSVDLPVWWLREPQ